MTSRRTRDIGSSCREARVYRHDNLHRQRADGRGTRCFPIRVLRGKIYGPASSVLENNVDRNGAPCKAQIDLSCIGNTPYDTYATSTISLSYQLTMFGMTQYGQLRRRQDICCSDRHRRSIERCILMATDPGDLVLDPTCGSGTTAYVAEQWGRRWITIDTSRVALALAARASWRRAIPIICSPTAAKAAPKKRS